MTGPPIDERSRLAAYVGDPTNYPVLENLQPDLYRCFMSQVWGHQSKNGISSLVHPETHFTDEKAGLLRENTYLRLRRHWQFVNELFLFSEIDDHVRFGIHIYGATRTVGFDQATGLYHPDTVVSSYLYNGMGKSRDSSIKGTGTPGRTDLGSSGSPMRRSLSGVTCWNRRSLPSDGPGWSIR